MSFIHVNQMFHLSILNEPVSGVPSAPVDIDSSAVSLTSVLLSWNLPPASDTNCPPETYTITITTANLCLHQMVINTTDDATKNTVSGLTQGMEYSFIVAGVDAGGRLGENSAHSNITTDS